MLHYEDAIDEVIAGIEPAYEFDNTARDISIAALEEVERKFGRRSEQYLPYHNAEHAVDVCRRGVRLANVLYPFIRPSYQRRLYEIVVLGGALHDIVQDQGSGENEKQSALWAVRYIKNRGSAKLNTSTVKKRLGAAITATEVHPGPSRPPSQVQVRQFLSD